MTSAPGITIGSYSQAIGSKPYRLLSGPPFIHGRALIWLICVDRQKVPNLFT